MAITLGFALTKEVLDQIVFGMENQSVPHRINSRTGLVRPLSELAMLSQEEADLYLELPAWTPADGFQLMEGFVQRVHNPLYKQRLRHALDSGRRVFRTFKDIVQEQPLIQKQWHDYKEERLQARVRAWYQSQGDANLCERLGEDQLETETDDLVLNDFCLRSARSDQLERLTELEKRAYAEVFPEQQELAAYLAALFIPGPPGLQTEPDLVAETPESELAGFLRCATYLEGRPETGLLICRCLYVLPAYRGLGLGGLFLDRLVEQAGQRPILVNPFTAATYLERRLLAQGFAPCGTSFLRQPG